MATKSLCDFIQKRILLLACDVKNKYTSGIAYQKKSNRNSSETQECFTTTVMSGLHECFFEEVSPGEFQSTVYKMLVD